MVLTVSRGGSLRGNYNHRCGPGKVPVHDLRCVRIRAPTGAGPLTADALVASIGNARDFKNGRQLAAWLGLVPSQHSSGGHARLGTISCRGDAYLRTLLIQGARSSLQRAKAIATEKATPEQLWAMLAHDVDYDPAAFRQHPLQRRHATA